jgi:hypothetical protein
MLVGAAVLIPTSARVALSLLLGAAGIGAGVGLAGGAIGFLLDGKALTGTAGLGLGVGLAGGALGFLLDGQSSCRTVTRFRPGSLARHSN